MTAKVRISDVAKMAGVSASTVSKVLKNYPNISEQTREKVMSVIGSTGYIPNSIASALSSKTNKRIAIFVHINDRAQQIDEINMQYMLGCYDQGRKDHLDLVTVFDASIESMSKEETARYFHSLFVDTIIVFGLNKNDEKISYLAQDDNFKMVIIDAPVSRNNVSTVMIDHQQGQYEVANCVCDFGDKVLYLKGRNDGYVTDMRLAGMKKLAEEKKLQLDVIDGEFSEEKTYQIVKDLKEEYDAIVCASDMMAIGCVRALPESTDVKISGFDGIRLLDYVTDDVYTCRQNFHEIGSLAVIAAEKLSKGEPGEEVIAPYEIGKAIKLFE